jgi:hypothetical protein
MSHVDANPCEERDFAFPVFREFLPYTPFGFRSTGKLIGSVSRLELSWRSRTVPLPRTLGQIGFVNRSGYTAIGTVCNPAARLCAEAKDGQVLCDRPVAAAVGAVVALEQIGDLLLKGSESTCFDLQRDEGIGRAPALRVVTWWTPSRRPSRRRRLMNHGQSISIG